MAKKGTADFEELKKRLEWFRDEGVAEVSEKIVKEQAARLLREVILLTPARSPERGTTGTLRGAWQAQLGTIVVQRRPDGCSVELVNNTEYASYVESGHRTTQPDPDNPGKRKTTGWVKGRFWLKKSEEKVESGKDVWAQKHLGKALKGVFDVK